jgi:hypothetical protein
MKKSVTHYTIDSLATLKKASIPLVEHLIFIQTHEYKKISQKYFNKVINRIIGETKLDIAKDGEHIYYLCNDEAYHAINKLRIENLGRQKFLFKDNPAWEHTRKVMPKKKTDWVFYLGLAFFLVGLLYYITSNL